MGICYGGSENKCTGGDQSPQLCLLFIISLLWDERTSFLPPCFQVPLPHCDCLSDVTKIHNGVAVLFEAYQLELSISSDRKPNLNWLTRKKKMYWLVKAKKRPKARASGMSAGFGVQTMSLELVLLCPAAVCSGWLWFQALNGGQQDDGSSPGPYILLD